MIGLGRVGATIAAAMASRGAAVIGVDVDPARVGMLNGTGQADPEPGLADLVAIAGTRLRATTNHREAVLATDVTYIIVPTPSDGRGAYALDDARSAFAQVGAALADKQREHVVVLASTVLPGATLYGLAPTLQAAAGRPLGNHVGLCYSPPFVALGSVMRDFLSPDFALIGEDDRRSGAVLEAVYRRVLNDAVAIKRMSIENAELTKLAVNTFLTAKIAFANSLAEICERLPGGDVDAVTEAMGTDRRIGTPLLRAGLGYGGPCLPRDNAAFAFLARAVGARADLGKATDELNCGLPAALCGRLGISVRPGDRVAVLGLGYKAASPVIEASQGLLLACALASAGADVRAFDPSVDRNAATRATGGAVALMPTLEACLDGADGVVVASADPAFSAVRDRAGPAWIVDVWRALGGAPAGARLVQVGRSVDDARNASVMRCLWDAA